MMEMCNFLQTNAMINAIHIHKAEILKRYKPIDAHSTVSAFYDIKIRTKKIVH